MLLLVGFSYVGRASFMRMASPLDDSFNMDVLDAKERATNTGLETAVGAGISAIAALVGSRLLDSGDYTTPFMIMAIAYLISIGLYWRVFRPLDASRERLDEKPAEGPVHGPDPLAVRP